MGIYTIHLLQIFFLLPFLGCTSSEAVSGPNDESIKVMYIDSTKIKGNQLNAPAHLEIQNDSFFWLSEYNGSNVAKFTIQTGKLLSAISLDSTLNRCNPSLLDPKINYSMSENSPRVAECWCNHSGNCYLGFFVDYNLTYDENSTQLPISYILQLDRDHTNPLHVQDPHLSPWDNQSKEIWVAIDRGFAVCGSEVFATNAMEDMSKGSSILVRYQKVGSDNSGGYKYLNLENHHASESLDNKSPYPVILLDFVENNAGELFYSDGRQIRKMKSGSIVFKEAELDPKELIMTYSIRDGIVWMLTGKRQADETVYTVRKFSINSNELSSLSFIPSSKMYSFKFSGNKLYYVAKTDVFKLYSVAFQ